MGEAAKTGPHTAFSITVEGGAAYKSDRLPPSEKQREESIIEDPTPTGEAEIVPGAAVEGSVERPELPQGSDRLSGRVPLFAEVSQPYLYHMLPALNAAGEFGSAVGEISGAGPESVRPVRKRPSKARVKAVLSEAAAERQQTAIVGPKPEATKRTGRASLVKNAFVPGEDAQTSPVVSERKATVSRAAVKTDRITTGTVRRNTDRPSDAANVDSEIMFSISVDGEHVAGTPARADPSGIEGTPLEAMDVQVKFDGLEIEPTLNVSTLPIRKSYRAGEKISFLATANYPAFINRAEIWITAADDQYRSRPAVIIPVDINGTAFWTMPADGPADYSYVLRVYDVEGRFDETAPLILSRTVRFTDGHERLGAAIAPGLGEDRTAKRNIPVRGGAVTVYGRDVPPGYDVRIMGEPVPVDRENAFVIQRILPAGDHSVDVEVDGGESGGIQFERAINIPANDWFYVALADVTIGYRDGDSGIETVRPGEFGDVYTKGRLAFYLKGKIKGQTLLTAAADTGEGEIESLFQGFDEKSSRDLLRRLDPDDFYPIYGDDSTTVEDAPTRGKFYVRLERGDSHVMWGNYKTVISNTELMRSDRALYGANAVYRSPGSTSFGERRTEIAAYAAQPGTLPQRDVFRGTGGSAYFLKYQDITAGSETVTVEVRDSTTGAIIERKSLQYGTDYELDYIQGVIILAKPLSSIAGGDDPVRESALDGQDLYLIVQYEFTPAAGDVDGYVYGGRVQHWLGE
ncbi:MAG: hypothetical protein AB3N19_14800, partial [Ruegeria sp.]